MPQRLEGQIAIVTGSDSGIGQATALAFAREGADVAVTYLHDRSGAEETLRGVRESGRKGLFFQLDQTRPESVEELFRAVRQELGVPTLLVNNAAMPDFQKQVKDMELEEWDRIIRTDLYGPFFCSRLFIRGLEGANRNGVIINVTSVHEEIPGSGGAGYCAAKGGLRNLTRVLALELAQSNIRVNNLAPGMVLTPMNQQAMEDSEKYRSQVQPIPMKRAAAPAEIAAAAVFLASTESSYVHGTTLFVDGGLLQAIGQGA